MGLNPLLLEESQVLAEAETIVIAQDSDELSPEDVSDRVNALHFIPTEPTEERKQKLCKALRIDEGLEQKDAVVCLVLKYHDVFTLDDTELGVTCMCCPALD